jgi:hypothetical protein
MYEEDKGIDEAELLLDEIEGHETDCTPAQATFVRACRKRLSSARLNEDDVDRLGDILDDLDRRGEYGDGYDDDEYADVDQWEESSESAMDSW